MRRLFAGLLLFALLLVLLLLFNTYTYNSVQSEASPIERIAIRAGAISTLQEAIRIQSISGSPYVADTAALFSFHSLLRASFPLVHEQCETDSIAHFSLLYRWKGKSDQAPILFAAHMDVVPVENAAAWEQPPFSGNKENDFIYGRGTLDDKFSILGLLEAAESLLREDWIPPQDIYFAFGHDEEVGGTGAQAIVAELKSRGVQLEMALDEGSVIGKGLLPGFDVPVGLIAIAEKGFANVELKVAAPGGHSSMPPPETAVGIVAKAITKIEANQMPQRLDGPTGDMFDVLGPEFPLPERIIFANKWLFNPLIKKLMAGKKSTNAATRTTTAPTMLRGSVKENVLAAEAWANINFRIYPGDSSDDVIEHLKRTINDPRVAISFATAPVEPSPISDPKSESFRKIERCIKGLWSDAIVVPNLCIATTDGRYYDEISNNVFRFIPIVADETDVPRIHGANERIGVEAYNDVIRFYRALMEQN